MRPETTYYLRSRHRSIEGRVSGWAPTSQFRTKPPDKILGQEVQTVLASDRQKDDVFGSSVALSANGVYLAIGAPMDDDTASNSGAIYIYIRTGNTWSLQQKIQTNDANTSDNLGLTLGLSDDGSVLIAGVYLDDDNGTSSGSAYVFTRTGDTWTQLQKLTPYSAKKNYYFGKSVVINGAGTRVLIGAPNADSAKGKAYLFDSFPWGWQQTSEITPNSTVRSSYFGTSVALSGDGNTAFVGACGSSNVEGVVYLFNMPQSDNVWWWTEQLQLRSPTSGNNDGFGQTLALSEDGMHLLVGQYSSSNTTGEVIAHHYNGTDWVATYRLISSDRATGDYFGAGLGISGDGSAAVIGAYGDDDKGSSSGSTYSFKQLDGVWSYVNKNVASDGASGDLFGSAVAVSNDGTVAAIGAKSNDTTTTNTGSVYVFV